MSGLTLVADVGGTNSRVAVARAGQLDTTTIRRYPNAGRGGLDEILAQYLAEQSLRVEQVCAAIAGPVEADHARMTNLDWQISSAALCAATGAEQAFLLNDLQAQGYALPALPARAFTPIVAGTRAEGAQLVLGLGTGVNAAPVQPTRQGRHVAASESGHIALPVLDAQMLAVAQALKLRTGSASVEEALSGRGVVQVHEALHGQSALDGAGVIAALAAGEPQALATGRLLTRILGAVLGDMALVHLPFGGLYLCGSVARALAPHLAALGLAEALRDKGRFSGFMEQFSVALVEDDFAALTGCALYLARS